MTRDQPLAVWSEGVCSIETAGHEMTAVSSQSWSPDPLYHVIASFGPDERPSFETARATVESVLEALGFSGLQMVASLADDGASGHSHVHAIVNRVDPLSGSTRPVPRGDWHRLRDVMREVELRDAWRDADPSTPTIFNQGDNKGVRTSGNASEGANRDASEDASPQERRSAGTNERDRYGVYRSFEAFVQGEVRPRLVRVVETAEAGWSEWTSALDELALRYEVVRGIGGRIVGAVSGWAARVRDVVGLSHEDLVGKFGAWIGATAQARADRDRSMAEAVERVAARIGDIPEASGWAGVRAEFGLEGLGYERHRGGARVVELDGPGWMRIDRRDDRISLRALGARFGDFDVDRRATVRHEAREAVERAQELARAAQLVRDPSPVLQTLFHTSATVWPSALTRDLERRFSTPESRADVRRAVLDRTIAVEDTSGIVMLTTPEVLREERAGRAAAADLAGRRIRRGIRSEAPAALDEQQAIAYRHVTRREGALKVVTGVPGAGKTTLARAVDEAYRAAGYRTRGVAVANAAVEVLSRETGIPSRSVAREISSWSRSPAERMTARDVVLVDEVSTLGTAQGAALLSEAARAGAVVVAFGDDKQFQAVARGDGLRLMLNAVGDDFVDLSRTRRQRSEWMRSATEKVRGGDVRGALADYRDHGCVHELGTRAEARAALIDRWTELERSGVETSIETFTNAERRALNVLARAARRTLGGLGDDDVTLVTIDGPMAFSIGDRVIVRERIPGTSLINGSVGAITAIDGSVIEIDRGEFGRERIDTGSHPGVQHAYCSTEFREQGATRRAELQFVTRHVHQRSLTVGMTRHTETYEAFYAREEIRGGFDELVRLGERSQQKTLASDFRELGRATEYVDRVLEVGR